MDELADLGGMIDASSRSDVAPIVDVFHKPEAPDDSFNFWVRYWATEIEATLDTMTGDDVEWMADQVSDLPKMIASLKRTRDADMVLGIWFRIAEDRRNESKSEPPIDV